MIKTLYPCFQKWSEKGSVYIISDTHFDDSDRNFMGYWFNEEIQISRLKERCHKNDTLIHLGDVGNPEYMNQLKCYKVLIMGNHDQSIIKMQKYFNEVYSGPLWIAEKILLSHEPLEIIPQGVLNIHGHDHSHWFMEDNYHLNLCPNLYGYLPLNLKNLIEDGWLKKISSIHRLAIDNQKDHKK